MANLFEKPIAANPMSEFVALPLQFIDQTIQRRQAKYDKARAMQDQVEDDLYGSKFLPGDAERNLAIREGYEKAMDEIVESVGGDYSQVTGRLDSLKRRIKQDLHYGELGAQGRNYDAAMKQQENYTKLYQNSKIQKAGMDILNNSISSFKTDLDDSGRFSTFRGYTPSNVVDPLKDLQNSVGEIKAKYDQEGQAFISPENVQRNVLNKIQSNPELLRAMQENYIASGSKGKFEEYLGNTVKGLIEDNAYKKYNTLKEGGASAGFTPGMEFLNFQMPNTGGDFAYTGASVAPLRSWAEDILGVKTTEAFKNSVNTPEAQERIKHMEKVTNTTFPDNYYDQQAWIEKHLTAPKTSSVVTRDAKNSELAQWIDAEGQLKNPTVGMYDQQGNKIGAKEIRAEMGKTKEGKKARALGIVTAGGTFPEGSAIIQGTSGKLFIQPPSNVDKLASPKYALWQINKVKNMVTGHDNINLRTPMRTSAGKTIPSGTYTTRHNYDANTVTLLQNGTPRFVVDENGNTKAINPKSE